MSDTHPIDQVPEIKELKPVKQHAGPALGTLVFAFGATLLVLAIVIPALLGPAVGNVFSNIVNNL